MVETRPTTRLKQPLTDDIVIPQYDTGGSMGHGLLSESPKYRDWTITPDMDFHVLGKVLTAWKSEQF